MTLLPSIALTILSALLLALGIPNEVFKLGLMPAGLVCMIPLYLVFRAGLSWRRAAVLSGIHAATVHLVSSFWLANFKDFAIFTLGASTVACFFLGITPGLALKLSSDRRLPWRPLVFALGWTLWEWSKSTGFLAYPWGTIVMTSRDLLPLIQVAEYTGIWGISFILVLFNTVLAELLLPRPSLNGVKRTRSPEIRNLAVFTGATLVILSLWGLYRLANLEKPHKTLSVLMIQHNTDSWDDSDYGAAAVRTSQELTRGALTQLDRPVDLVIWSESVLPWPWQENREYYRNFPTGSPMLSFLEEIKVPLLTGAPVLVDPVNRGYSNSVILLEPDGRKRDWYAKIQLVPFAEYMPFTEYRLVRDLFKAIVGFSSGWVPGTDYRKMQVTNHHGQTVHFTTPICFEDAFPLLNTRLHNTGSEVLINLTNDSWSKTDSAEYQHFVIASFRSIELRTTLLRSTNSGYTVVVDPSGRVTHDLPVFVSAALAAEIPVYPHRKTFYARFGDWFPLCMTVILLILMYRYAGELRHIKPGRHPLEPSFQKTLRTFTKKDETHENQN